MTYPLVETFLTWQGEGCHAGTAAFFIRLYGCPVQCPWCDTLDSWHPAHRPARLERRTPEQFAELAAAQPSKIIVLTGGEPCIHDLGPLTAALRALGRPLHLETSGYFPITGAFDWVTMAPKAHLPLPRGQLARAHELKIVVDAPQPLLDRVPDLRPLAAEKPVWLVPEWSQRDNPAILRAITQVVLTERSGFRAGLQTHKYYGVA